MSWPGIPPGVHSRNLKVNDLNVHILEAQPSTLPVQKPSLLILLHGFPELSYSWRKVILPLSQAGYHVVAPDQRGYGRTKRRAAPQDHDVVRFEDDLSPFRVLNLVTDAVSLVYALGYKSAAAVVGHDYGSNVAGFCALIRPDIFKSVVMMSAPFTGAPKLTLGEVPSTKSLPQSLSQPLADLTPPRKHYTMYYSTVEANTDMTRAPQGLHSFLRAYYHVKSADWPQTEPYPLPSLSASSFGLLPDYYVMPLGETMPDVVNKHAPSSSEVEQNTWLTEAELAVYTSEYAVNGFQGGLNRYRCMTDVQWTNDLRVFSGKRIEVPAMFMAGRQDWGTYQLPGAVEIMKGHICERMDKDDFVLIDGAGHWVQQEAPEAVVEQLLRFLETNQ